MDKWCEEVTLIHPQLVAHWRDLMRQAADPQWRDNTTKGVSRHLVRARLATAMAAAEPGPPGPSSQASPKPALVRSEELVSERTARKRSRSPEPGHNVAEEEEEPAAKRARVDEDLVSI